MRGSIKIINELFERHPTLKICEESIKNSIDLLYNCFNSDHKLLICGNGGSAADSQHIVGELMKSFNMKRPIPIALQNEMKMKCPNSYNYFFENINYAFPAMSLVGETSLSSAISNDVKPDLVYAQQLIGYGKKDDILLVISTSGKSKNILNACQIARALGMKIIGLTGEDGGELIRYCDVLIKAPAKKVYLIQEYHLPIYHAICLAIENEFFGVD